MVRVITTSHTYRQSSRIGGKEYEFDPANRYLARGSRFRMPSWMIRDQALSASGLLSRRIGGAPVNTYQPPGVWEEASFGKKTYERDDGEELYRRSLYIFWRRIIAPTMFFDSASRQTCTVKVGRTNTPLQALQTLNDVTYVEAARVLAQRLLKADDLKTDRQRLDRAMNRILARNASDGEAEDPAGRFGSCARTVSRIAGTCAAICCGKAIPAATPCLIRSSMPAGPGSA